MGILQGYDSLGRAIGPSLSGFMLDQALNMNYYTAIVIALLALVTLLSGSRQMPAAVINSDQEPMGD